MTNDNKQQKLSDSTDTAIAYSTCYRLPFLSLFHTVLTMQIEQFREENYEWCPKHFGDDAPEKAKRRKLKTPNP